MPIRSLLVMMLWLAAVLYPNPAVSQDEGAGRSATTKVLLRAGDYQLYERSFAVSPDSRHVAVAAMDERGDFVVVDGAEGPRMVFVQPHTIAFSPDSRSVAYAAGCGASMCVVVDGLALASFPFIKDEPMVFSPDGTKVAFVAGPPGDERAVEVRLDYGRPYTDPFLRIYGYNGAMLPFVPRTPPPGIREGPRYSSVVMRSLAYAPGSSTLCYTAVGKDGKRFVFGSMAGEPYDEVQRPVLAADGEGFAYSTKKGGLWRVVVGSREGAPYRVIMIVSLALDRDGLPCYIAYDMGIYRVVHGETEIVQSKDIKALALGGGSRLAYAAAVDGGMRVFVDGAAGELFDQTGCCIVFSPDGGRLAYAAMRGGKWFVVCDARETGPYKNVIDSSIRFSPDGGSCAFVAMTADDESVPVVDGKPLTPADGVPGELVFSPDGSHLANVGATGKKQYVAVDGKSSELYDGVVLWSGGRLVFDDNDSLHYLAVKKDVVMLVEETIE